MANSKKDINSKLRNFGEGGAIMATDTLDGTNTEEILALANPASKVSFQRSGTLDCTVDFSINGKDYPISLQQIVNNSDITTYSTSMVRFMKVTRTGGTGKLIVAYD